MPLEARVTPEGSEPVSLNVMPEFPVAVTLNVPAAFSANVVDAAEVMEGPVAVTVKVKDWVDVLVLASVAVMVIG